MSIMRSKSYIALSHSAFTTLVPQALHSPARACRFPWSEGFDCILRNEGVTGSNPVSSTDTLVRGCFSWPSCSLDLRFC